MTEVTYLSVEDLLQVARRVLVVVQVRDPGGLASAAARPQTTVFGEQAYPSLDDKAAALAHSIAKNHPLLDGNKRLTLASLVAFYGVNGRVLDFSNDEAYDLVTAVATGVLDDVAGLSTRLHGRTHPR